MKKTTFIYCILLASFIASCGKSFLEEDNKGGITNEEFYATADGYKTLITASYAALRDVYGNTPEHDLAGTDIYMEGRDKGLLYRYELFADNAIIRTFYERAYTAIQYTNAGLFYNDKPTTLTDQQRKEYRAELQFLRAFYHFILIEQFGGIVINEEYTNSPRINIPRSSLADSYNFVIKEMEEALTNVTATVTPGRVNKDVINHYLAKVYLTRGWDLGSDADFNKAKSYADAVITRKGGITIPYANLWGQTGENNAEFLFTVQYSTTSIKDLRTGGNSQQVLFSVYGGSQGQGMKRMIDAFVPANHIHRSFQQNDNRYKFDFMWTTSKDYFTFYGASGDKKVLNYYPVITDPNKTTTTAADTAQWIQECGGAANLATGFIPFPVWANKANYNKTAWGSTDRRLPPFKKFDCPENAANAVLDQNNSSVRDIVLARLAETYFLKAEACIALNQLNEARTLVQTVIDRPGNKISAAGDNITNALDGVSDKAVALEAYLLETGKEMLGEYNGRWPLLRRTKMLKYMLAKYNADFTRDGGVAWDDRYNLRPIPQDAIILNDALTEADQNAGY